MGLDKIRQEIDLIDAQMKELFLTRMGLSAQVIAVKKETGGAVYVPERESEIIEECSKGVEKEKLPEYQMFLKQIMAISRTYQYSKIADMAEEISDLPKGEGKVSLKAFEKEGEMRLCTVLDAAVLAGLSIVELSEAARTEAGTTYHLTIAGDFSEELGKGAILQIFREMEQVQFLSDSDCKVVEK